MLFVKKKLEINTPLLFFSFVLVVISVFVFSSIIARKDPDIYDHNVMALGNWDIEVLSHPFYFLVLKFFSGFTCDIQVVNTVSIVVLSIAIVGRFLVINFLLARLIASPGCKYWPWILPTISFSLCIVHAIPYKTARLMLGLFTPTIWHNSTIIFLVPLALLSFWHSYQISIQPSIKNSGILSGLLVVSNLIKPNFFLCLAPAFLLLLIYRYKLSFNRKFWYSLIPIIAGAVVLAIEYWIIISSGRGEGTKIGLFVVWNHFTGFKLLSFLLSFAFPLSYLVFHFRSVRNDKLLVFVADCFFGVDNIFRLL